ncbi:MAG: glutamate-1-semialdehyde 2,1-aminomutase [Deltaproteobacteria bacterium]|nr:glutamate-1-semialdehyde 2,1-aminomutase [Deltaproteobacteria bacterium]
MQNKKSDNLFKKANLLLPGGVNSPVRAFRGVGGNPLFIEKAWGAYISDVDKNIYIDYVGSWGPMILGHAHPKVTEAICETAQLGTSFGAPCKLEVEMAELLCQRIPSLEKVRLVNSGTEAVMGAIRLARAYTGKNKIVKFIGAYHGHADYLLVKAGSGAMTLSQPDSLGVPKEFVKHTLLAPYNDIKKFDTLVKKHSQDVAAIIIEPIAGNMGLVLPQKGFLQAIKRICQKNKILLIFDEVMTGFRVHPQGAQGLFNLKPDLTTFGKIIGGGLPVGAYGGAGKIMNLVSPQGPVYQAGTLSGNPLAMAAGIATLKQLNSKVYLSLQKKTERLAKGLKELADQAGISVQVHAVCGMFSIFFTDQKVSQLKDVQASRLEMFKAFFHLMLQHGIYLPPSPFEACFVSVKHGENEIAKTLRAAKDSFFILKSKFREKGTK